MLITRHDIFKSMQVAYVNMKDLTMIGYAIIINDHYIMHVMHRVWFCKVYSYNHYAISNELGMTVMPS